MRRPRNSELSIVSAVSMCSGSANSTYAYLMKGGCAQRRSRRGDGKDAPFWVTCKLITDNGDAVDCAASLEMSLYFFGSGAIVDLRGSQPKEIGHTKTQTDIPNIDTALV